MFKFISEFIYLRSSNISQETPHSSARVKSSLVLFTPHFHIDRTLVGRAPAFEESYWSPVYKWKERCSICKRIVGGAAFQGMKSTFRVIILTIFECYYSWVFSESLALIEWWIGMILESAAEHFASAILVFQECQTRIIRFSRLLLIF